MRLKCFLSVQEKDFARSREERNTVDFTSLTLKLGRQQMLTVFPRENPRALSHALHDL